MPKPGKLLQIEVRGTTWVIRLRREGNWYVVDSPMLEGLHTQGKTEEEAIINAKEAAELLREPPSNPVRIQLQAFAPGAAPYEVVNAEIGRRFAIGSNRGRSY